MSKISDVVVRGVCAVMFFSVFLLAGFAMRLFPKYWRMNMDKARLSYWFKVKHKDQKHG